jgi:hypothetical protein
VEDQKSTVVKVPDGKGGWVAVEPGTKANLDADKTNTAIEKASRDDFFQRVGTCTEALNKYVKIYANDHGLKPIEIAAAVYLENCNNRYFFPKEVGGQEAFDHMTSEIWDWFVKQVKSSPK